MSRISFVVWAAMALMLVTVAGAQSYSITDLGLLSGSTDCAVSAINDHGAVVGSCIVGNNDHAYLWTGATGMQDLGTLLGDAGSVPSAINNLGEVVGTSFSSSGSSHAFIWSASAGMQKLGPSDMDISGAVINDSGEVAGDYFVDSHVVYHAFVMTKNGTIRDIGTLGGAISSAAAINQSGAVVGFSTISNTRNSAVHAFRWTDADGMQDLGNLGGGDSEAYAVSTSGEVFGGSNVVPGELYEAFFWTQALGMESLGAGPGSRDMGSQRLWPIGGGFRWWLQPSASMDFGTPCAKSQRPYSAEFGLGAANNSRN